MRAGTIGGLALLAILAAPAAEAQLANETLLVGLPKGFRLGFQQKTDRAQIAEYVPQAETVDNWTQMVTVQVFFRARFTPAQFEETLSASWKKACPDGASAHIRDGDENKYQFSFWLETCGKNPKTGKPEMTWMKAIAGRDSLYLVQKAFRYDPSKDEVTEATRYLRDVQVCDTRGDEHPCPKVGR